VTESRSIRGKEKEVREIPADGSDRKPKNTGRSEEKSENPRRRENTDTDIE
jgi:hypothetical protein